MRSVRLAALAILALETPGAVAAADTEIVVRGDAFRLEIERILDADNVDTSRLGARQVAEAMGAIDRGRAPEDFWKAYRAHVAAWNRMARSEARLERALAEQAIDASFDEVERIARRYRARLPVPPWKRAPAL